ncbi:tyrosine-type recombinase/integrase [Brachyspira pilosicoli]|uniref:tyrosine-type recombinase/integrase n=1 Tax=Brachyspira pilosicoli TaxID=52584 RepID=UPI000E1B2123|nr:tyrosine-type recombinase/integrase [Brachyspira pilosicoli]SUV99547.1 integrase family protein [Brachyspira pilosicoli]SUW05983.1 integrase family protein [Brachyspira pilosicoli]SUW09012.1 integrase family protein [Brachyspira pilosicoli]
MELFFNNCLSFNCLLNDNNAINNSLYLPENNLTSGELFMVYYKEFANYYSFNNSKNTIAHNLSLLKKFFELDIIKNKKINELEKKDIKNALSELNNHYKKGSGAINCIIAALRKYFYFINENKIDTLDLSILKIPLPKKIIRGSSPIRFKEVYNFFIKEYPKAKTFIEKRDLIAILLYSATGARKSELIPLKISDIDFQRNTVKIFQPKTQKYRYILISNLVIEYLNHYLIDREKYVNNNDCVFITEKGSPIKKNVMSELSKRLEKYNIKFHIHQFRAGFVNDSYESGNDLPTTQRLVGHENISTTERHYLNVGDKYLQEAAQRMPSFTTASNTSNQDKSLEAVESKKEINNNIDIKYLIENFETVKQLVELLKAKEDK